MCDGGIPANVGKSGIDPVDGLRGWLLGFQEYKTIDLAASELAVKQASVFIPFQAQIPC
jgi:hypothetical protein